jgi:hypothetical protein
MEIREFILRSIIPFSGGRSLETLGDYMSEIRQLSRQGRWILFAGIPVAVTAALFVTTEPENRLEHAVGETALPYVLFFVPVAIVVCARVLYDRFPKRMIVPVGIASWILGLSLLCWFFWFGPGALKMP